MKLERTPPTNDQLVDQAIKQGAIILRAADQVAASGARADLVEQTRPQPRVNAGDARLEALLGAIASRLGTSGFVKQTVAATAALRELNDAHMDAAARDTNLFTGVAALGRIERSLGTLSKLGHVEGLPDLQALVPETYLTALRERWYPAAQAKINELLRDHAWMGLNMETIQGLTELGRTGDATISRDASLALEPMLTRMLEQTSQLEVAGLLALFPPEVAVNQLAILKMFEQTSSPALREALGLVISKMQPAPETTRELLRMSWDKQPAEIAATLIRARSHATGRDIHAALAHHDPRIQAAGLDALTRQWQGASQYRDQVEALLARSTEPGSKKPIDPLVKSAAIRAMTAVMRDTATKPGMSERVSHLRRRIDDVLAPFASLEKADPDPSVRQAALEVLLRRGINTSESSEKASVSHVLLRAVEDPALGGQAIDALRRIGSKDGFYMGLLAEEIEKVRRRTPTDRNERLKLELVQLYDVVSYHRSSSGDFAPMLHALSDSNPEVRAIAGSKLLQINDDWSRSDLKALEEVVVKASKLPADSKVILAEVIVKGHQDFEPVYGRETSPFPALAQTLSKVAKSEPVTKILGQLQ
jgi:hypothetical protein